MEPKGMPKDKMLLHKYALQALGNHTICPPGVMIYNDVSKASNRLSDAELGKLVRALFEHRYTGDDPDLSDDRIVGILYESLVTRIDLDAITYAVKVMQNRYNASGSKVVDANGKTRVVREDFPAWFSREFGPEGDCQGDYDTGYAPDNDPDDFEEP